MAYEDRIVKDNMHKRLVGREQGTMNEISEPLTFVAIDDNDLDQGYALMVGSQGSKVAEILDETDLAGSDVVFSEPVNFIRIFNFDTDNFGLFTINGLVFKVAPGFGLETGVGGTPSATVSVSGSTEFVLHRLV